MKHWLFTLTLCFGCLDYLLFDQLLLAQENYIDRLEDSIFYLPDGEVIALSKGRYQTQNTVFRLNKTAVRADINDDKASEKWDTAYLILRIFRRYQTPFRSSHF